MADFNIAYSSGASCKSCTKQGQDVVNGSCPLWMADGRSFGDFVYKPRCQQQYPEQFTNNFDYRLYLIQNAEAIIKENSQVAGSRLQRW
jgi:hypothetical protein